MQDSPLKRSLRQLKSRIFLMVWHNHLGHISSVKEGVFILHPSGYFEQVYASSIKLHHIATNENFEMLVIGEHTILYSDDGQIGKIGISLQSPEPCKRYIPSLSFSNCLGFCALVGFWVWRMIFLPFGVCKMVNLSISSISN